MQYKKFSLVLLIVFAFVSILVLNNNFVSSQDDIDDIEGMDDVGDIEGMDDLPEDGNGGDTDTGGDESSMDIDGGFSDGGFGGMGDSNTELSKDEALKNELYYSDDSYNSFINNTIKVNEIESVLLLNYGEARSFRDMFLYRYININNYDTSVYGMIQPKESSPSLITEEKDQTKKKITYDRWVIKPGEVFANASHDDIIKLKGISKSDSGSDNLMGGGDIGDIGSDPIMSGDIGSDLGGSSDMGGLEGVEGLDDLGDLSEFQKIV